ncbi:MAG: phage portal protein [Micromonosporaceae bacterium]|nr:phage portal protein [Micromonosporaceae bacterium]
MRIGPLEITLRQSSPPDTGGVTALIPGLAGETLARTPPAILAAYREMPWLRAVADRIAASVASTHWTLYAVRGRNGRARRDRILARGDLWQRSDRRARLMESGELEELDSHPLLDLLDGANEAMTGLMARRVTQLHIDIAGESFWVMERNRLGVPMAVWPIPPSWVIRTPTPDRPAFEVSFRGWQGEIPASEVVWFALADPANPYGRGAGFAETLADELDADEYAAKYLKSWFLNSARPDLIVSADGLKREDVERLEQGWVARHVGFWKAFKPFFANKRLEVKEISQSLQSMQFTEVRHLNRDTVMQVFGVPPEILGVIESSNRATIESADYLYARYVLVPRLEFLRAVLQERLVPEFDDRLILDFVSPVVEDQERILNAAKAAPWARSVDEWRALQGLPPLDNEVGNVFLVPANLRAVADPRLAQVATTAAQPDGAESEPRALLGTRTKQTALDVADSQSEALADAVIMALDRLREIDREALAELIASGDIEAALDAVPTGTANEEMTAALAYALGLAIMTIATSRVPGLPPLPHDAPALQAWLREHVAEAVQAIDEASRAAIREAIRDGLARGLTPAEIAREIRPYIGLTEQQVRQVIRYREQLIAAGTPRTTADRLAERFAEELRRGRALRIAEHELLRATHMAQQLRWEEAIRTGALSPNARKRWNTSLDERVCPVCMPLHGATVPVMETFAGGFIAPPAHVACRCHLTLVEE